MDEADEQSSSNSSNEKVENVPQKIWTRGGKNVTEWTLMKSVDEAVDFEEIREQHRMNFNGQTMFGKRSTYTCAKYVKCGCKFKMIVQTSQDGQRFHIYTANEHNHPLPPVKVAEKPESFHANKLDFRQRSSNEENMEIDAFVKRLIAPKQEEISFEKFTKDHLIKQQKVQTSDQRKSLELKKSFKSSKWRLQREVEGALPTLMDSISQQYSVQYAHKDSQSKRILFCCPEQYTTEMQCQFKVQLISNPIEGQWRLYTRFRHTHSEVLDTCLVKKE